MACFERASAACWHPNPILKWRASAARSAEALEVLKGSTVDMVLLDFDVGTEHGNDFIAAARQAGYQGRFLIVAGSANVRNSAIALKLGASGIFLKSETPDAPGTGHQTGGKRRDLGGSENHSSSWLIS